MPSSFSSTTTFVKFSLPVFVTVILYLITSPSLTSVSSPKLSSSLNISITVFSTLIPVVGSSVLSVSLFPTVAIFVIFLFSSAFISFTITVNVFWIVSTAGTVTSFHVNVSLFLDISAPSTVPHFNIVPVGILSLIVVVPFSVPVFVTEIVYFISSPTFAMLTFSYLFVSLLYLNISLVLLFVIIDVFSSLLSSPFAIALFVIVPVTSESTTTVNLSETSSPAFTVIIHFTPTIFSESFEDFIVIPSFSTDSNVVFEGILSITSIFSTSLFPLFFTFSIYVIFSPAYTNLFPALVSDILVTIILGNTGTISVDTEST